MKNHHFDESEMCRGCRCSREAIEFFQWDCAGEPPVEADATILGSYLESAGFLKATGSELSARPTFIARYTLPLSPHAGVSHKFSIYTDRIRYSQTALPLHQFESTYEYPPSDREIRWFRDADREAEVIAWARSDMRELAAQGIASAQNDIADVSINNNRLLVRKKGNDSSQLWDESLGFEGYEMEITALAAKIRDLTAHGLRLIPSFDDDADRETSHVTPDRWHLFAWRYDATTRQRNQVAQAEVSELTVRMTN